METLQKWLRRPVAALRELLRCSFIPIDRAPPRPRALPSGMRAYFCRVPSDAPILEITNRRQVEDVDLAFAENTVTVDVGRDLRVTLCCPTRAQPSPGHDSRRRPWRHLAVCLRKPILVADVPRVKCARLAAAPTPVASAEPGSGFTALLVALVMGWLKESPVAAKPDLQARIIRKERQASHA